MTPATMSHAASVGTAPDMAASRRRGLVMMAILFALFGFVTWLNGVLIPFLKVLCQLSTFEALLVTFAFYIAYFVMALPSARVLQITGYQRGLAYGIWVMAAGTLFFIPAALTRAYGLFLAGLFLQGSGLCLLQTAANPYVIALGPHASAAQRVSIMGVCNKLAGAISPLILGALIFVDFARLVPAGTEHLTDVIRTTLAHRLIAPYLGMIVILATLAVSVSRMPLPILEETGPGGAAAAKFRWWRQPLLVFGFWALFFEMAVEVIAGDTIVLYAQSLHMPIETARYFATMTLMGMVLGYVLGVLLIPRRLSQEWALASSAALGIALALAIVTTHGMHSVLCVAALGIANAVLWPCIFPLAIRGLGSFTKTGSAIMIMAIAGGAVVPPAYGLLAHMIGNQLAYLSLVPMYAVILAYALFAMRRVAQ
jgi:FHS family L-fucose permease-like MFS transporter